MPIDSQCSGCGKTLRVNDEFLGREARCPACGFVYVVGQAPLNPQSPISSPSDAVVETTYAVPKDAVAPAMQPPSDSWSSLPTEANSIAQSSQQPPAVSSQSGNTVHSSTELPQATPIAELKFFVRTPNSMIYGPSDKSTVLDWIDQGRLDDTCHIRDETSEQWLGIAGWRFQMRKASNPVSSSFAPSANRFGDVPTSTVQSFGYAKTGNGTTVLVLGLVSWLLCPTVVGGWICAVLAIVFASVELNKIRSGQTLGNEKWLVLLGMWLGIAHLVVWVLAVIGLIVFSIVSN